MTYTYKYPRPALTVDTVVLANSYNVRKVLLIRRKYAPFEGFWAMPGGFVNMDEDLETAAKRELEEETGFQLSDIKQFRAYGHPERDPRQHTVTIVFVAFVERILKTKAADDASEAAWFNIEELPPMAFDHQQILNDVLSSFAIN